MSNQLCVAGTWGIGSTASVQSPHPWLQSLKALTGERSAGHVAPYLIQATQSDLRRVAALPDDWDGAGSIRPKAASVANAAARLPELCRLAMVADRWVAPHVSASEVGEITFEWWEDARKLTIYFGDHNIEVLRVWGPDMNQEMDHHQIVKTAQLAHAWAWLYGN